MDLKPSRHQARVGRWPPDAVVAYAAIVVTILAVSLAREGAHERLVYGGLLLAFSTVGLWRSVWIAWLFLVFVVGVGGLAAALLRWPSSWAVAGVLLHGTMLALLVSRPTRRYARRGRPRFLPSFDPTSPE
jgi:hypothetical protein